MKALHIVFDGPPGPTAGRFVEIEDENGVSFRAGEWHERADGLWEIRIQQPLAASTAPHVHVAGTTIGKHIDECALCGDDLRSPIHLRITPSSPSSGTRDL